MPYVPYGTAPKQKPPRLLNRVLGVGPDFIEKPIKAGVGGYLNLWKNLSTDVADAAIGLFPGLVAMGRHPVSAIKNVGASIAYTWSPLVQGHPLLLAQRWYDHPLAPILDIATVFTAGAGGAARAAGALSKAGHVAEGSKLARVAALRTQGTHTLVDPKGIGIDFEKPLSSRAGRRLVQNTMIHLESVDRLPTWYRQTRYNTAQRTKMAHGVLTTAAVKVQGKLRGHEIDAAIAAGDAEYLSTYLGLHSFFEGGKVIVDDLDHVGRSARSTVLASLWTGLAQHGTKMVEGDELDRLLSKTQGQGRRSAKKRHYGVVYDPMYADAAHFKLLKRAEKKHARLSRQFSKLRVDHEAKVLAQTSIRDANKTLGGKSAQIERELNTASDQLNTLREMGGGETPYEVVHALTEKVSTLRAGYRASKVAKTHLDEAEAQLAQLHRQAASRDAQMGEAFQQMEGLRNRATEDYFRYGSETYDALESAIDGLSARAVGADLSRALRDEHGRVTVVPLHDAYNLQSEAGNSLKFVRYGVREPLRLWKQAVLLYTPRIVTNNGVGNWFLEIVRNPTPSGMRAISHTMFERYGRDADVLYPKNHYLYTQFSDEMLADTFGIGNDLISIEAGTAGGWARRASRKAKSGFYPLQYQLAEKPVRASSIRTALYNMEEVQTEIARLKRAGVKDTRDHNRAISNVLEKRPDLRDAAALESRRVAGDYVTMRETEKLAKDIIPFYLWQRHILKTTGNMFADTPGRLAVGARLSDYGFEELQQELGDVPSFLRGVVPLHMLGFGDNIGRANILLTSSLNPFATVGDMADGANAAFFGGGVRRGAALTGLGVSPFITGPIESITQTSLLTGAPSPRSGSIFSDSFQRMVEGIPLAKLTNLVGGENTKLTPAGNSFLFARDNVSTMSWLTGFTIKDMEKATANALAQKEKPKNAKIGYQPYG